MTERLQDELEDMRQMAKVRREEADALRVQNEKLCKIVQAKLSDNHDLIERATQFCMQSRSSAALTWEDTVRLVFAFLDKERAAHAKTDR